ncbi:GNAT family N-acetyltransferase [uncultured Phenylobacterium sp.]|uniref:GNAT family N-acetyltransferase n=1 Tax=uncultured Phenylobacterium sp. TaxID=349273 RepID=UPI0025DE0C5A|nr:GNAT family N-acetyltransferase [uncultured Phenylobacterium sp.]
MEIRPYEPADRAACLAVFDSNTPRYFDPAGREAFESFLANAARPPYFVMDHDGAIVGCGGYAIGPESATLGWGMVRADLHGQGLGRFLLMYRLREIGKVSTVALVRVETSAQAAGFYEKQGFRVTAEAGRIAMTKKLTVCA